VTRGAAITLDRLNHDYDGVPAVVDVSIDIVPGEFLTLLGPSGSGKTTTLMLLAGFLQPTSGRITIDGREVTDLPPHRRDFGIVFQNYALFPHMTVADNVGFALAMRKTPKAQRGEMVERARALVNLPGVGGRFPRQLSGGQQQRVALARALVFEPAVLLMDEPLGALDKKLRERMQIELKRLHERLGMTVVHVTHDQDEALSMSDRVAVMQDCRLVQIERPADLYLRPTTRFVADFVGESNLIEGVFERRDGTAALRTKAGTRVLIPHDAPGVGADAPVVASVRPERIRVFHARNGSSPANCFEGTVTEVMFAGGTTRYVVELAAGDRFIVRDQDRGADHPGLARGASVLIGWGVEDVVLLSR
jgi:putative spermidine/putrescine transport system ATP-binding protein